MALHPSSRSGGPTSGPAEIFHHWRIENENIGHFNEILFGKYHTTTLSKTYAGVLRGPLP
jgi:hypothetical protein